MPTPQGPRSSLALDGIVPGLTWADFTNSFKPTQGAALGGGDAGTSGDPGTYYTSNLPGYTVGRTGGTGASDDFGNLIPGSNVYSYDSNNLGDGTVNQFSEGPNGSVMSKNTTQNNDSWWDSTGLPLVASLAFGGATAAAAAGGIGVSGAGAGLANVGAGFAADSAAQLGANYAAGAAGGLGSTAANGVNDIASANYNPYDPSNFTASNGAVASDATNAAGTTNAPWYQQYLDTAKQYGFGNGPIGSAQNVLNGTGQIGDYLSVGSNANSIAGLAGNIGGSSSDTTNPFTSVVNQYAQTNGTGYTPPTIDTSYINNGIQTPNIVQNANGSFTDATNYGGGSSSGGNGLLGSISNLYNNGITNGSASDYNNLLQAGLGIAGAVSGSNAAQTAAGQQTSAINNANALTAAIYGDTVNRNKPFVQTGTTANNTLGDLYGTNGAAAQNTAYNNFQTSPDYKFAFDEGQRAVQSGAAASGGLYSGRAAKDLTSFGQGLGSQQFGAYTNGLRNLSQTGQSAANNTATAGAGYSNQASNLLTAGGIAQSAGTIGSSNAITNALNQFLKNQAQNGYYGG